MDPGTPLLAGRYRLEDVIGRGGMSTVYRAQDTRLGRTVAVKVLLAGLADEDPAYVARFEREARAAAALRSPAVVAVYDVGVDGGQRFIVMEYVAGRSLATLLSGGEPLPVEEAVRVAREVANVLGEAHARGIVHRDIKPANVMIADDDTVKVLDFGVARMLEATTITHEASVLGTAAYMAPERALGEPGDARADIYSLGCLLYAMLTGAPPFRADLAAAVLHQHINAQPRKVGDLRPGVPVALDALVGQMLAKSPEARPASAYVVRDRLETASDATAATAPIAATAPTTPIAPTAATIPVPPPRRATRPAPALAAGLAAAAIALVVLLIATAGGSPRHAPPATARTTATTRSSPTTTTAPTTTRATTPTTTPVQSTPPPPGHAHPGHGPPGHGPPPDHGHGKDKGKGKGGGKGGD